MSKFHFAILAGLLATANAVSAAPAPRLFGQGRDMQVVQLDDRWRPGSLLDHHSRSRLHHDRGAHTFGYEYAPAPHYGLRAHRPRIATSTPSQRTVYPGPPPPWTEGWYARCAGQHRSFDRRSGTFLTYAGKRRFCR